MKVVTKHLTTKTRSASWRLYTIGDVHIGKVNCCERAVRRMVDRIKNDPNAVWVGGGDLIEAIKPSDAKRWDTSGIADWMFTGSVASVKERLRDVCKSQIDRIGAMLDPIADKCIGLIEGNHEQACRHYSNSDVHGELCRGWKTEDLTDCAFLEFLFKREAGKAIGIGKRITCFVTHGHGGGRSPGAEPNHLTRLLLDKSCEIAARGHSHTYFVLPPIARVYAKEHTHKTDGRLGQKMLRAFNWGTYLLSYPEGPSTYESRAGFQARPLMTACAEIAPFCSTHCDSLDVDYTKITVDEIDIGSWE